MKIDDYGDFGALQFHAMLRMMINDKCPCGDELHKLAAELRNTYDIAYTQNELFNCCDLTKSTMEHLEKMRPVIKAQYGVCPPNISGRMLPIWDLAAFVVVNDKHDAYGIGLSYGAVRLIDAMSYLSYDNTSSSSNSDAKETWTTMGTIAYKYATGRFNDIRHWFVNPAVGSLPYGMLQFKKPEAEQLLTLNIIVSFILAHEVAHIMDGHMVKRELVELTSFSGKTRTIQINSISWENENIADRLALETVLRMYAELENGVWFVLRDVTFFLNILELIEEISIRPVFWGHHHPPSLERRNYLFNAIKNISIPHIQMGDVEALVKKARGCGEGLQRLADSIVKYPDQFRKQPDLSVFNDYVIVESDNRQITEASQVANIGYELLLDGNADDAYEYLKRAISLLEGCTYGEGYRILYSHLVQCSIARGSHDDAINWLEQGLEVVSQHNDKPAAMAIAMCFSEAIRESGSGMNIRQADRLKRIAKASDKWLADMLISCSTELSQGANPSKEEKPVKRSASSAPESMALSAEAAASQHMAMQNRVAKDVRRYIEEDLQTLPHWARVAFAVRCAQRVAPLYKTFWPGAPAVMVMNLQEAISKTKAMAQHAVSNEQEAHSLSNFAYMAGKVVDLAIDSRETTLQCGLQARSVAECVASAARAADPGGGPSWKSAADSALAAICAVHGHVVDPHCEMAQALRSDFELIKLRSDEGQWTDESPIPSELFLED
jgi:tetratricopeptide (TPR) repeat protein